MTKVDRDVFVFVLGLVCTIVGAHALVVVRLQERIRRLEDEVKGRASTPDNKSEQHRTTR